MIRGRIFSELQAESRKLRTKSQSYSQAGPQNPEPNRPGKGPEWGLGASAGKPPESFLESTEDKKLEYLGKALRASITLVMFMLFFFPDVWSSTVLVKESIRQKIV